MAYNPDDYDEIYETKSAPEKTELLGNGWVLLDERFETASGEPHESFAHQWLETATRGGGRGGYTAWSRAGKEPEFSPAPPHETTYVLGWPQGQKTVGEDDADGQADAPTARPTTAPEAAEASADALPEASVAESGPSESPDAPTAPTPPRGLDEA